MECYQDPSIVANRLDDIKRWSWFEQDGIEGKKEKRFLSLLIYQVLTICF